MSGAQHTLTPALSRKRERECYGALKPILAWVPSQ